MYLWYESHGAQETTIAESSCADGGGETRFAVSNPAGGGHRSLFCSGMKRSIANRLLFLLLGLALLALYVRTRDTISVEGEISREEQRQIVAGIQEWSAPKFFRHIEIEQRHDGTVWARVREPGDHWSATEFTMISGTWNKSAWFLLEKDKSNAPH
jgi:hypothetical protein